MLKAIVCGLAVTPESSFIWPSAVRRTARGCFAVSRGRSLRAAVDGRYLSGSVTPMIALALEGVHAAELSARCMSTPKDAERVRSALCAMGLLDPRA